MCNNFSFYIGTTYVLLIAVGPVVASSLHVDVEELATKLRHQLPILSRSTSYVTSRMVRSFF